MARTSDGGGEDAEAEKNLSRDILPKRLFGNHIYSLSGNGLGDKWGVVCVGGGWGGFCGLFFGVGFCVGLGGFGKIVLVPVRKNKKKDISWKRKVSGS